MLTTTSAAHPALRSRRVTVAALFSGAALMNAAMAAASAVSTIVAADALGAGWGGVPNTAGILGTGIGALVLTRVMNRHGRRAGLMVGYVAAATGGAVAVAAVARGSVAALGIGMVLLGLGNAGAQLSRYAAAEQYPAQRRGFAIGTVIWAGTIGAVGGPLLLMPSSEIAAGWGFATLAGPFLFAAVASGLAVAAVLRAPSRVPEAAGTVVPIRSLLRTPAARSALAVMATGQVVMVAVMTAAPLDMHMHGQGLGPVGAALSAHTLGMFALSPLTGRMLDRVGARPVMRAGLVTLAIAAALAATAPEGQFLPRAVALFLLGYGWNLCFVGGSGRLARGLPPTQRVRVEGAVDAAVWGAAAVASLGSTMVLAAGGYAILAIAAGALVLAPAVSLFRRERAVHPQPLDRRA